MHHTKKDSSYGVAEFAPAKCVTAIAENSSTYDNSPLQTTAVRYSDTFGEIVKIVLRTVSRNNVQTGLLFSRLSHAHQAYLA